MDREEIEDLILEHYDNCNYNEIVALYDNVKDLIEIDDEYICYVIESLVILEDFNKARILVDNKLNQLKSDRINFTEEELDILDYLISLKVEILYEKKLPVRLALYAFNNRKWIIEKKNMVNFVNGSYGFINKRLKTLLYILSFTYISLYYFGSIGVVSSDVKMIINDIYWCYICTFLIVLLIEFIFKPEKYLHYSEQ